MGELLDPSPTERARELEGFEPFARPLLAASLEMSTRGPVRGAGPLGWLALGRLWALRFGVASTLVWVSIS
jgi:hypothetical protein